MTLRFRRLEDASGVSFEKVSRPSAAYWLTRIANAGSADARTEIEAALNSQYPNRVIAKNRDGEVVGAIAYGVNEAPGDIHVELHHVGSIESGVGSRLVKRAIAFANKNGLPLVLHPRDEAVDFYRKLGFKSDGKTMRIETASQVDTSEFKSWFGKSKVVDDQGKPLRVYHGSDASGDIEEFLDDFLGIGNDQYGSGFYFTDKPEAASAYASGMSDRPNKGNGGVLPVYLRIENPIVLGMEDNLVDGVEITAAQALKIIKQAPNLYDLDTSPIGNHVDIWSAGKVTDAMVRQVAKIYTNPEHIRGDFFDGHTAEFLKAFQQTTGHDGVIKHTNDGNIYVIFNGRQAKSATGNSGKFDPNSGKLADAVVETVTQNEVDAFEQQVKMDLGLTHFSLFLNNQGNLKLNMLEVPKTDRKTGVGTQAMEKLCQFADEHGLRLVLTTGQRDDRHGTTSSARLLKFYKRFGFVHNFGRNKDYSLSDNMYRDPKTPRQQAESDIDAAVHRLA